MVSVNVAPPVCWSLATSRSSGRVFILARIFGAHGVELAQVGVEQRILILGAGQPSADIDVLGHLQEQRGALDLGQLAAAAGG